MFTDLRTFISRIPHSYKIQIVDLKNYLSNLEIGLRRLEERTLRFTNDPIPSMGIDFLNSLITRADIPYLLKFHNDFDRFAKIVNEYESPAYSDFIRQYPIRYKNFIYSQKYKTAEYLIISEDIDIVETTPFGSNNFNDWMKLHPLTMLSNDSRDIELDIITSKLKYQKNPPYEVIFSINVVKLLMLYTKYRLLFPEEFVDNTNNYPFIFKTCLIPLLEDNLRTWILKSIYDIVVFKSIDPDLSYTEEKFTTTDKSTFVLNDRRSVIQEIEDLIDKCVHGKVKPDEVITSLYVDKETSLLDLINTTIDNHYIGFHGGAQYRWLEFVKEYFILATFIGIYGLQPENNRSQELKKLFDVVSKRLANTRFWSNASQPFVVENIKSKFDIICSLI
jgi:hypothetical protein